MMLPFAKYHGTGNDFILIDNRNGELRPDRPLIASLCHRRFGIGADGLMLLQNQSGYDFSMAYYNSDGKESTMCGNGGRCMVAFAHSLGLAGAETRFLAIDGVHTAIIEASRGDHAMVALKMNDVGEIEASLNEYLLDSGSPHFVRFCSGVGEMDVLAEGKKVRWSDRFAKEGVNVDFTEEIQEGLFVRTYERGVEDETWSCGTGAVASAIALAVRKDLQAGPVSVRIITKGGELRVVFSKTGGSFSDVWLKGPAVKVFEGQINI